MLTVPSPNIQTLHAKSQSIFISLCKNITEEHNDSILAAPWNDENNDTDSRCAEDACKNKFHFCKALISSWHACNQASISSQSIGEKQFVNKSPNTRGESGMPKRWMMNVKISQLIIDVEVLQTKKVLPYCKSYEINI